VVVSNWSEEGTQGREEVRLMKEREGKKEMKEEEEREAERGKRDGQAALFPFDDLSSQAGGGTIARTGCIGEGEEVYEGA